MELWDQIRSSPSSRSREGLPRPRVVGSKGLGERALGREAGVGEIRPPVMLSMERRGEAGKGDRGQQRLGWVGQWRNRCACRVMPGKVNQESKEDEGEKRKRTAGGLQQRASEGRGSLRQTPHHWHNFLQVGVASGR